MDQLATRLRRLQDYSTQTEGGYYIANFHVFNAYNGQKTFRLHYVRKGALRPSSFDVVIHYADNFVVNYKDPDQDTQSLSFADYESVIEYLTTR